MSYHDQPFSARQGTLGDIAEDVFMATSPLGNAERFGWRRPENISMKTLTPGIRNMPDFYAASGYLVEVAGLGKDGILKSIKVEKYESLKTWRKIAKMLDLVDVALFVWNSYEERFVLINWESLVKLVAKAKKQNGVQSFADGNEYYPINWEWLIDEAAFVGVYNVG
jgi:hypothetical protein